MDNIIRLDSTKTIEGNYINAPTQSGRPIDVPTEERVTVELDGKTYERTIYERLKWHNSGAKRVTARFVIVVGVNYAVDKD